MIKLKDLKKSVTIFGGSTAEYWQLDEDIIIFIENSYAEESLGDAKTEDVEEKLSDLIEAFGDDFSIEDLAVSDSCYIDCAIEGFNALETIHGGQKNDDNQT